SLCSPSISLCLSSTAPLYTLSLHDALPILPTWPNFSSPAGSKFAAVMFRFPSRAGLRRRGGGVAAAARGRRAAARRSARAPTGRSEEHTSELQSRENLVCRLLLEKKNYNKT